MQLMVALRFYATGCFQQVVGDIFGIDKTTVSRIIEKVSRAFSVRLNEFVRLPTPLQEADQTIAKFYQKADFPNVVGCIDCTHVQILAPTENEHVYVNRKGRHSINVQLVCDADLIIINCVVNWPGSVHDSRILRESNIFQLFETLPRPIPGILLGDAGYPLKEWLMTPFTDPQTREKERFNGSHCSTRSTIERTNGVLKKRWHCLHSQLRYDPPRACRIIMACIVLHNVAMTLGLPDPDDSDNSDPEDGSDDEIENGDRNGAVSGRLARERIVARYFHK
ncbi:hypothetical protein V1264_005102 [Littorina saxatilis]|uniref:Putative nuclease HARBI1 n=1 Tax=Littorina saxatilis TaxID=31220 RepID=A0AAN9G553_9CAEN